MISILVGAGQRRADDPLADLSLDALFHQVSGFCSRSRAFVRDDDIGCRVDLVQRFVEHRKRPFGMAGGELFFTLTITWRSFCS